MSALAQAERRVAPRQFVQRGAECRLGGAALTGMVRDESRDGVFFAPTQHGDVVLGKPMLSFEPELDELVLLTYASGNSLVRKLARVRWYGYSQEHSCEGLGLAFDDN